MTPDAIPPQRPGRRITGMSAVLLPFDDAGVIAWDDLAAGVARTAEAGLVPAVNMDTGYGPSLDAATRRRVLAVTADALGGRETAPGWRFVAGAHVDEAGVGRLVPPRRDSGAPTGGGADGVAPGGPAGGGTDGPRPGFDVGRHRAAAVAVAEAGGVPIVFPSAGLAALPEGEVAPALAAIGSAVDGLLGFELGRQFHPLGRIWTLETFGEVLEVPQVVGAKHSSLRRAPEWARLAVRDAKRPDFLVLTGNDLAIDMVRWGSDYLLGLSTFAPEAFARRDRLWAGSDPRAFEVDDALQALGALAFRDPVPAYRHDAALVWHRRGWAPSSRVHPGSPTRPEGEDTLVATLLDRLDTVVGEAAGASP